MPFLLVLFVGCVYLIDIFLHFAALKNASLVVY